MENCRVDILIVACRYNKFLSLSPFCRQRIFSIFVLSCLELLKIWNKYLQKKKKRKYFYLDDFFLKYIVKVIELAKVLFWLTNWESKWISNFPPVPGIWNKYLRKKKKKENTSISMIFFLYIVKVIELAKVLFWLTNWKSKWISKFLNFRAWNLE